MKDIGWICSQTLEIIEQGDVAHVLEFSMKYARIDEKPKFVVTFKYLEGCLEDNIVYNFDIVINVTSRVSALGIPIIGIPRENGILLFPFPREKF